MPYYVKRRDVQGITGRGTVSYPMLTAEHGCVNGFSSGFTICSGVEYPLPGVHEDQEGFVVLEGRGWAKVGTEEFRLGTGHVLHCTGRIAACREEGPGSHGPEIVLVSRRNPVIAPRTGHRSGRQVSLKTRVDRLTVPNARGSVDASSMWRCSS